MWLATWLWPAAAALPPPQCPSEQDMCDLCLYQTLDALVDAVPDGLSCTFELDDGTYGPVSLIGNRDVTLIGSAPGAVTLISTNSEGSGLVRVEAGATLTMEEVTVSSFQQRAFDVLNSELNLERVVLATLASVQEGGALRATNSSVSASDSLFLDNAATQRGGAVLGVASELVITGCQFLGGFATEGGAIWVGGGGLGMPSALTVLNSTFLDNVAGAAGGALFVAPGTEVAVIGSRFERNFASVGGAVADGTLDLQQTQTTAVIDMSGCVLDDNEAFDLGGAIAVRAAVLDLADVQLNSNEAELGGALHVQYPAQASLERVTLCDNQAVEGGAVLLDGLDGRSEWRNLRLIDNVAAAEGGGLKHISGELLLLNSNLLGNSASGRGGAIRSFGGLEFRSGLVGWSGGAGIDASASTITDSVFWRNPEGNLAGMFTTTEFIEDDPQLRSYLPGGGCAAFPDLPGFHGPLRANGYAQAGDNPVAEISFDLGEDELVTAAVTANDIGAFGGPAAFLDPWTTDDDADGVPEVYDCDDADKDVAPLAVETYYDGVDQNCDLVPDDDQDGDGFPLSSDCDDEDPLAYPGADEPLSATYDLDCDGIVDHDKDGFAPPEDCDDDDASVHPGVVEDPDVTRDANCDGVVDVVRPLVPVGCTTAGESSGGAALLVSLVLAGRRKR